MLAKALQGAALATIPAYIEDVFSTWLYTGNNTSQTITNNIDLSTKGGMVWIKARSGTYSTGYNVVNDTARGAKKDLYTNTTGAESANTQGLTSFNTTGFAVGNSTDINGGSTNLASWTFREQAKFFDVVTYTGNGASGARAIAHNLGSTPGCYIVKRTDSTSFWPVYHRMMNGGTNPHNYWMALESTSGQVLNTAYFGAAPTSTNFYVADNINANGGTYVAYLFAHDAGGFGAAGTDNVISCGSFSTNASGAATVTLGYEPQWVLWKAYSGTTGTSDWDMFDNMRGYCVPGASNDKRLQPNSSGAEGTVNVGGPTATGFTVENLNATSNYIYIAIRRGPMRTPTSGTSVYEPVAYTGNNTTQRQIGSTVLLDALLLSCRTANSTSWGTYAHYMGDRLRGVNVMLATSKTDAESGGWTTYFDYDTNVGWDTGSAATQTYNNATGSTFISHAFRRAPGFFDVVCYTGNATNRTVNHNLGVAPELMIIKSRSAATDWRIYSAAIGAGSSGTLDTGSFSTNGALYWNSTAPTSTVFTLGSGGNINANAATFVAYLFATVTGVSKVGSYQGNGTSKTIDCGFTAGARFIMIKRTDSTGDWYVWDTARGIVSGNDPHLSLNTTGGDVTTDDTIDPDNSGFIVNQVAATNVNVNNASYIFLAVS